MEAPIGARQRNALACLLRAVPLAVTMMGTAVAADVRVFSSGAPADVAKVLAAKFAEQSGHSVLFTVANPAAIQQKLASGETPDIVLLPAPTIAALETAGRLRPGSQVAVARVGVGIVVRVGAPLPDISTAGA